jgi:hypothetical protein
VRKSRAAGLAAAILGFVVAGCVYSENGPARPDGSDSVLDPSLLGVWRARDRPWQDWTYYRIERMADDSNEYAVVFTSADPQTKAPERWERIRLVRIGDTLFLDAPNPLGLVPTDDRAEGVLGGRCLFRMRRSGDRFVVDLLNERFVRAHPKAIAQVRWGPLKRSVRITATRDELRAFLNANVHNEAAWVKSSAYVFEKVETRKD